MADVVRLGWSVVEFDEHGVRTQVNHNSQEYAFEGERRDFAVMLSGVTRSTQLGTGDLVRFQSVEHVNPA